MNYNQYNYEAFLQKKNYTHKLINIIVFYSIILLFGIIFLKKDYDYHLFEGIKIDEVIRITIQQSDYIFFKDYEQIYFNEIKIEQLSIILEEPFYEQNIIYQTLLIEDKTFQNYEPIKIKILLKNERLIYKIWKKLRR